MDSPEVFLEHVNVSRETIEKLEVYANLLLRWQVKVNLVSTNSLERAWHRHFLDSAQIFSVLPKKATSAIDVGTGAGFPGLVLSIMGLENVQLVEQNKKKCAFLYEVIRETEATALVYPCKIEKLPIKNYDVVLARAFMALDGLLKVVSPFFGKDTLGVFPKGLKVNQELTEASKNWKMKTAIKQSITNPDGKIVMIKDLVSERQK
tara:strand:- start:256 stop:873 length:618 start_codon:yes stop_codon:yes gene_type:complete